MSEQEQSMEHLHKKIPEKMPPVKSELQREAVHSEELDNMPPIVHEALQSPGQPLNAEIKASMEPHFEHDFSKVRVHTDEKAAESAEAVNAQAYTSGHEVVFGEQQYAPHTKEGKELLAHELTHVVQQHIATTGSLQLAGESTHTPFEEEAEQAAEQIAALSPRIRPTSMSPITLHRQTAQPDTTPSPAAQPQQQSGTATPAGASASAEFLKELKASEEALKILEAEAQEDAEKIKHILQDNIYLGSRNQADIMVIVKKWAEKPRETPRSRRLTSFDYFLAALRRATIYVGWLVEQQSDVFSQLFARMDKAQIAYFQNCMQTSGYVFRDEKPTREITFFGTEKEDFIGSIWEDVKNGKVAERIGYYFLGLAQAGVGLLEGVYLLIFEPNKVLEGIGNLPSTVKIMWKNKEKLWNDFLNADPNEQARIIGRIFGEAEIIIATVGAGGGKAATSLPELAPAMAVQKVGASAAAAALPQGGTISINLGKLGEAGRLTALMSKAGEVSVEGKKKAEELKSEEEAQLDKRIAEAEEELNPARQKTLDYQTSRAAEGKSLKGGPIKGIWNIKERIWLLRRQKLFPGRTILEQPEIVGVKTPAGTVKPTSTIAGKGRTPDFLEVEGSKTVAGDLKSASEIKESIAGGIKKPGPVEAEFKDSSKIAQQHQVEAKILEEAQKQGGKIVIKGKNVLTGEIETIEVDPTDYSSTVVTYEDVLPN